MQRLFKAWDHHHNASAEIVRRAWLIFFRSQSVHPCDNLLHSTCIKAFRLFSAGFSLNLNARYLPLLPSHELRKPLLRLDENSVNRALRRFGKAKTTLVYCPLKTLLVLGSRCNCQWLNYYQGGVNSLQTPIAYITDIVLRRYSRCLFGCFLYLCRVMNQARS